MIADAITAERIGLDWLRAALAPAGAFGRRHDERIAPYGPGDEALALAEIADVDALAGRLSRDGVARARAAVRAVPEPSPIAARARAGDPLGDVDFYELGRFVDAAAAVGRAWDAAGGGADRRPPVPQALRDLLAPGRDGGGFYLADAFAPGLAPARAALERAETDLAARRAAIAARVRDATGIDVVGEEFTVLRDLFDGPLPDGVLTVRETPTYRSAAIRLESPERDAALNALTAAEEAARAALGERVAAQAPAIDAAAAALGALDRLLARIAFTQRWGGCVPRLDPGAFALDEATFAPLAEALGAHGRRYTALSFELSRVAVLTGPNMGGKSAALATAGFACACVTLGVPPPARYAALPLLDAIVWIGGDAAADRARLLSSYALEVLRARDALAAAGPRALILADEFARTTGPREGRALLVAFVEALRARGAFALVATHVEDVAGPAGAQRLRIAGLAGPALRALSAANLDAALDAINAAMDYRVVASDAARETSDALELARVLGLDPALVERARTFYRDGG